MPLIKVQTTATAPDPGTVEEMLKTLSSKLANHLGKSESYVMTAFEPGLAMTFGGTTDPVCFIQIKSIGQMKPEQTKAMSEDFCQQVKESLGVSPERIYLEFTDVERHLWGWKGSTFA